MRKTNAFEFTYAYFWLNFTKKLTNSRSLKANNVRQSDSISL